MTSARRMSLFALAVVAAAALLAPTAHADPTYTGGMRRYLPASGFNTTSKTNVVYNTWTWPGITNYNANGTNNLIINYDGPIDCPTEAIGAISFDYGLIYNNGGAAAGPTPRTQGGAAISGYFNPNAQFAANVAANGYTLAWIQAVSSALPGASGTQWGAGAGAWYADVGNNNKANPAYPAQSLAAGVLPAGAVGFQDFPSRTFNGKNNQYWHGDLGLAELNYTTHQGIIVGAFSYGFANDADKTDRPHSPPTGWTTGQGYNTSLLADTFDHDFNSTNFGGATNWNFLIYACPPGQPVQPLPEPLAAPEPAGVALPCLIVLLAAGSCARGRRRGMACERAAG